MRVPLPDCPYAIVVVLWFSVVVRSSACLDLLFRPSSSVSSSFGYDLLTAKFVFFAMGLPYGRDRPSPPDVSEPTSFLTEMPEIIPSSTLPPIDEKALGALDQSASHSDSDWVQVFRELFGLSWDGTVSNGEPVGGGQFTSDVVSRSRPLTPPSG